MAKDQSPSRTSTSPPSSRPPRVWVKSSLPTFFSLRTVRPHPHHLNWDAGDLWHHGTIDNATARRAALGHRAGRIPGPLGPDGAREAHISGGFPAPTLIPVRVSIIPGFRHGRNDTLPKRPSVASARGWVSRPGVVQLTNNSPYKTDDTSASQASAKGGLRRLMAMKYSPAATSDGSRPRHTKSKASRLVNGAAMMLSEWTVTWTSSRCYLHDVGSEGFLECSRKIDMR
ncbi:hypothetical protein CSAL01_02084 [Colletotrichum salicis]|uniref:Uncharacterized protein n=1 Tax=Colletotrichum salicis TaxID=1209931 RepID=A0A135V640_9PEZI|nr:hypothetical protein CSAL01_02084 [Colletotrichum salicis]